MIVLKGDFKEGIEKRFEFNKIERDFFEIMVSVFM